MTKQNDIVGKGVAVVIGVTIIAMMLAFFVPVVFDGLQEPSNSTQVQNEGETLEFAGFNATLDTVDDTAGAESITVTVTDEETGATETNTINESENTTYVVNGNEVTVYANNVQDATTAEVSYEYEKTYGWHDGASSLFNIMDLIIMLVILLSVVGYMFIVYKQR